jgi:hypothetical protein
MRPLFGLAPAAPAALPGMPVGALARS